MVFGIALLWTPKEQAEALGFVPIARKFSTLPDVIVSTAHLKISRNMRSGNGQTRTAERRSLRGCHDLRNRRDQRDPKRETWLWTQGLWDETHPLVMADHQRIPGSAELLPLVFQRSDIDMMDETQGVPGAGNRQSQ